MRLAIIIRFTFYYLHVVQQEIGKIPMKSENVYCNSFLVIENKKVPSSVPLFLFKCPLQHREFS